MAADIILNHHRATVGELFLGGARPAMMWLGLIGAWKGRANAV